MSNISDKFNYRPGKSELNKNLRYISWPVSSEFTTIYKQPTYYQNFLSFIIIICLLSHSLFITQLYAWEKCWAHKQA